MLNKTSITLLLGLAVGSAAQAQSCPCGTGTRITPAANITTLLANKMVCAAVGNEQWQEWHNGSSSGSVVDYKRGPGHPVDPSESVGTYAIGSSPTISYTYGGTTYTYAVCQSGATYDFCGAGFGGRDILGARVSASGGLQSCASVGVTRDIRDTRTRR